MKVFDYKNYKKYVVDRIQQMPKKGRGEFRKMADYLSVTSTVISQIFKGDRDLSAEQAALLTKYFGMNALETRYFINLILRERAGNPALREHYDQELAVLMEEANQVKNRITDYETITEEHKAIFYSDWIYSAVRNLSALKQYNNVDQIADYFEMSREKIQKVVDFLLQTKLCIEQDGKIMHGPQMTHLNAESPFINNHRRNWRSKAVERINNPEKEDLFYSIAVTLSAEDKINVKKDLMEAIREILGRVKDSPEEELVCMNIDWFEIK